MPFQTLIAGTGSNVTSSGRAWLSPGNITADDGVSSTNGGLRFAVTSTDFLRATNFGFTIPAGVNIVGIVASIEMAATAINPDFVIDSSVRLIKNGTPVGSDLATSSILPTTLTVEDYGGTSNLWGATWTRDDINSPSFGVQLQCEIDRSSGGSLSASVDCVRLTVHYAQARSMLAETDAYVCTFEPANFIRGYEFKADKNNINMTGVALVFRHNRRLITNVGSFTQTPGSTLLLRKYTITAGTVSYAHTTQNANLVYSRGIKSVSVGFTTQFVAADLRKTHRLAPVMQSYLVDTDGTGLLSTRRLVASLDSFSVNAFSAELELPTTLSTDLFSAVFFVPIRLEADSRALALIASEALLIWPKKLVMDAVNFAATSIDVGLQHDRILTTTTANYGATFVVMTVSKGYRTVPDSTPYTVGSDVGLTVQRVVTTVSAGYTLATPPATLVYKRILTASTTPYIIGPDAALLIWSRGIQADVQLSHWSLTLVDTAHQPFLNVGVEHGPAFTIDTKHYTLE